MVKNKGLAGWPVLCRICIFSWPELQECLQVLVDFVGGEAHYIVERALYSGDAHIAYPFLYTVGTCFVERLVIVYVVVDFLVGKWLECHYGAVAETVFAAVAADGDGSYDLVCASGQFVQHGYGLVVAVWLAEDRGLVSAVV